ncbi:MAG: hypothetical protein AAGG38_06970 [Planctomycetota bacterium]
MTRPAADRHERHLLELTSLPTAAGREDRVVAWVTRWARRRAKTLTLTRDAYGNLLLARRGVDSDRPLLYTAHLDHPAFVVTAAAERTRTLTAEFRGGVHDDYFIGARVGLRPLASGSRSAASPSATPPRGTIESLQPASADRPFKTVTVRFARPVSASPGDLLTWDLAPARIKGHRLHAPVCDDLAAVAAMFSSYENIIKTSKNRPHADVRLLCTRAEEIGFVGAIAACRSGLIPPGSRIIALENSKASADAPLGDGPVVRVGDRTSTFDPALTYAVGQAAQSLAADDPDFRWQRKLMTGGTCEASAYQALGHTATCICLALHHYHNMDATRTRIAPESIHLRDYHHLIRLLTHLPAALGDPAATPPLTARLDQLFAAHRGLLA